MRDGPKVFGLSDCKRGVAISEMRKIVGRAYLGKSHQGFGVEPAKYDVVIRHPFGDVKEAIHVWSSR